MAIADFLKQILNQILNQILKYSIGRFVLGCKKIEFKNFLNETTYTNVAILDFGLEAGTTRRVMTAALDLLAGSTTYSVRELLETLLTLRRQSLRARDNIMSREGAFFCSAMVQHCYRVAGIDLVTGVTTKNVTPEDIAWIVPGPSRAGGEFGGQRRQTIIQRGAGRRDR